MDEDVDSIVPDDANLEGYWDFSESSGTGAYLTDKSSNSNDGTPSGTIYTDGVITGGREFNGSSDYVGVSSPTGVPIGNSNYTIEAWIKPAATGTRGIVGWGNYGSTNQVNALRIYESDKIKNYWWGNDLDVNVGTIDVDEWHYVVATYDGTTRSIYWDGFLAGSDTPTGHNVPDTSNFRIGSTNNGEYFSGSIDEVGIYSQALSSTEIENRYNEGREIRDYSGNDNHGVSNGTDSVGGKISNSREFDGSNDYIDIEDGFSDFTSGLSIELWAYPTSTGSYARFIDFAKGQADSNIIFARSSTTNDLLFQGFNGTSAGAHVIATGAITNNEWHHYAVTVDGSGNTKIYKDGIEVGSGTTNAPNNITRTSNYIGKSNWAADPNYQGLIDEVRVSNVARSASEIYESYNIGKRMLQPEIKFKADLQSSNLITDSNDKTFDISETAYDTTEHIENLESGNKIIITEDTYKAQGTIDTVNTSTGAVTVESWDSGSTFPSGGYTTSAKVFKWQKEYLYTSQVDEEYLTNLDQISMITSGQANVWYDDVRAGEELAYLEQAQYVQYQPIFTRWDDSPLLDLYLTQVTIDYTSGPTMEQIMRHGKWFNSSGEKQPFWWVGEE
jgi:hypothetical protein